MRTLIKFITGIYKTVREFGWQASFLEWLGFDKKKLFGFILVNLTGAIAIVASASRWILETIPLWGLIPLTLFSFLLLSLVVLALLVIIDKIRNLKSSHTKTMTGETTQAEQKSVEEKERNKEPIVKDVGPTQRGPKFAIESLDETGETTNTVPLDAGKKKQFRTPDGHFIETYTDPSNKKTFIEVTTPDGEKWYSEVGEDGNSYAEPMSGKKYTFHPPPLKDVLKITENEKEKALLFVYKWGMRLLIGDLSEDGRYELKLDGSKHDGRRFQNFKISGAAVTMNHRFLQVMIEYQHRSDNL